MMMNESFLQRLIFYDKDNIPEDIFEALKDYVNHPQFQVKGWEWGVAHIFQDLLSFFFLLFLCMIMEGFYDTSTVMSMMHFTIAMYLSKNHKYNIKNGG